VLHVLTSDFDVGPVSIVPAFTGSLGFDPVHHFASCFPKHVFKQASACQRSTDVRKRRKAMMSLLLTQGAAVQVTKRPAAAVLTSQAEPRFVKVHKSRTSAKQSKQSTRRDLLTMLGKKPTPTGKILKWGGKALRRRMVHSCAADPQSCLGVASSSKCG
jgi:hypothetical protein